MEVFKTRLNNAFKDMRKEGLMARQDYLCCQSCAGYALTTEAEEKVKEGKKKKENIKGCVYYHHQDTEGMKRNKELYLAYGQMNSSEIGLIGLPDVEVGKIVCKCLEKNKLEYEWNGDGKIRILVKVL